MNTFKQSTGEFFRADGTLMGTGWAGQGAGENNPAAQNQEGIGPLPQGNYTIGSPYDNPHTGPFTMDLTPAPENEMFGRSLFRIHGAAKTNPELSSEGCFVQLRPVREALWNEGDRDFQVVAYWLTNSACAWKTKARAFSTSLIYAICGPRCWTSCADATLLMPAKTTTKRLLSWRTHWNSCIFTCRRTTTTLSIGAKSTR